MTTKHATNAALFWVFLTVAAFACFAVAADLPRNDSMRQVLGFGGFVAVAAWLPATGWAIGSAFAAWRRR